MVIKLLLIGCLMLSLSASLRAETLSLGFQGFKKSSNLFTDESAVADFARAGLLAALVHQDNTQLPGGYALQIANSFNFDGLAGKFGLRLRDGAAFTNGEKIAGEDLVFSLNRCQKLGLIRPDIDHSVDRRIDFGAIETTWVEFRAGASRLPLKYSDADQLLASLTHCPIVQAESSSVFGESLGVGTNFLAAGAYKLIDLSPGRELSLQNIYKPDRVITLRGFADSNHGLTALRTGTLDALVTSDDEVLAKAEKDETLSLGKCSIYRVVLRKGLQMDCSAGINLDSLRYSD